MKGYIKNIHYINTNPIKYYLELNNNFLFLNTLMNKKIFIYYIHNRCIKCKKKNSIYKNGYCYTCFLNHPKNYIGIIKPERCTSHLNIENKNIFFEKQIELQNHIVYLSITSQIKIGVTREKTFYHRMIEQGASKAIQIAKTPNRYYAGSIEVHMKKYIPDKTNYKIMLTKNNEEIYDLINYKFYLKNKFSKKLINFFLEHKNNIYHFFYPIIKYPITIKNINLYNENLLNKRLIGLKGNYLIFDNGVVLNIKNHIGYYVNIIL
jgi:hypothetical protein